MALGDDQIKFIKKNVKKLKSWKKVLVIYHDDDNVTRFAHKVATKLYGKQPKKKKGEK